MKYKLNINQLDTICGLSAILKMRPTQYAENLIVFHHSEGHITLDLNTSELWIPNFANNEFMYFAITGLAKMYKFKICDLIWKD
jgi:hypothetical protein